MEALKIEFRGKKAKSIMRGASRIYGKASEENARKAVNEAVEEWLMRMPARQKKTIEPSELTGAASDIGMPSLEAGKKAVQLFGSAD